MSRFPVDDVASKIFKVAYQYCKKEVAESEKEDLSRKGSGTPQEKPSGSPKIVICKSFLDAVTRFK